jgi:GT2 family glycosyltransferase
MPSDLVSVVVPTYNRAYCICKTLDSVVAQTHTNWEILVVDDGSTDETRQLIAETYGHDQRVRYLYQPNAGVSHARNTGIGASRGDFVAFLDSDDLWKPWKLAVQLACLLHKPEIGMIWTDMEAVDPEGSVIDQRHLKTMYSTYRSFEMDEIFETSFRLEDIIRTAPEPGGWVYFGDIYPAMIMGSLVHTSTVLMRRERLDKVKGFSESLKLSGEDYDFHLRTCKWGPVALIDLASIQYQKGRPDQLTNHSRAIAVNFLTTVQRAIQDDDATGRFPADRVRLVLAKAHGWIAEEDFKVNDGRSVRNHAIQSLRRRPLQPRLIALLATSCIPQLARKALIRGYRSLKG